MTGFWALVRFVSLRHLVASPVRSFLTLLGVALGVAMLVGMSASNQAILHAFEEMVDRARGKADLEVVGAETGVDQALVDELGGHTELVSHVAGRIEQTTFLEGPGGTPGARVLAVGVDFLGDREFLPFEAGRGADVLGDPLGFLNDPEAILVSASLARAHGLEPGSKLRMRTSHGMEEFHVETVLEESGQSRAFGGQVVVLFLDAAQMAFDRRGHVDRIDLALAPGVDPDRARAELTRIVGARGTVGRPGQRGEQIASMTKSFRIGLQAQAFIALMVGMFLIYNAVSVSVAQRRREIGVLRSLGVTRRRVSGVFLAEAAVLGLLGGVLGVVLGDVLARVVVSSYAPAVSRLYENIPAPVPRVETVLAVFGVFVGVVATLVAAWIPARRASRTSPVETMRRDLHAAPGSRPNVRLLGAVGAATMLASALLPRLHFPYVGFVAIFGMMIAAAFLTPGAVALLAPPFARLAQATLGLPARLGVDNVSRELGRSSLTACALVLATSTTVTVATFTFSYEASCMAWVEQVVHADIVLTAGSPLADRQSVPFSPAALQGVKDAPGVAAVDELRSLTVPYAGWRVEVLGLYPAIYLAHAQQIVLDGPRPLTADMLSREPAVLISENLARRTGLGPGGTITLPSPTGPHPFKVVAVVVDYSSDQGWMLVDRKYMLEYWRDDRVDAIDVYVTPGRTPEEVAEGLRARLGNAGGAGGESGGMFVTTNAVLKDEVQHVIRQTFQVSRASEVVALAVAVLGVVGTMLAAVLDRIREIGVLRAIGALRRQILFAVVAEAGFLGLCAALVGVVAAVPSAIVFVKTIGIESTGWSVPFQMPGLAMARAVASVVAFSMVSGMLPGWKAARLEITRALAYE